MIIINCRQIYENCIMFSKLFLSFHQNSLIFPSIRYLFRLTGNNNNTIIYNEAPNGTPPLDVAGVPLYILLTVTYNGKPPKHLMTHLVTNHANAN